MRQILVMSLAVAGCLAATAAPEEKDVGASAFFAVRGIRAKGACQKDPVFVEGEPVVIDLYLRKPVLLNAEARPLPYLEPQALCSVSTVVLTRTDRNREEIEVEAVFLTDSSGTALPWEDGWWMGSWGIHDDRLSAGSYELKLRVDTGDSLLKVTGVQGVNSTFTVRPAAEDRDKYIRRTDLVLCHGR